MTIASGISPNSSNVPIAVADFNNDGHLDLASNGVVYLGNGGGTFQSGLPYFDPTNDLALAVADFSGDGKPDLAVIRGFGVTFLFGNGDGTFVQGTSYTDGSARLRRRLRQRRL